MLKDIAAFFCEDDMSPVPKLLSSVLSSPFKSSSVEQLDVDTWSCILLLPGWQTSAAQIKRMTIIHLVVSLSRPGDFLSLK